jgi:hypothetical protein
VSLQVPGFADDVRAKAIAVRNTAPDSRAIPTHQLGFRGGETGDVHDGGGDGAAPRHCLASGPADRAYQKRTKYRQIYRYLPLLTLSNLFRVNSRWVDGDRVKMALYR